MEAENSITLTIYSSEHIFIALTWRSEMIMGFHEYTYQDREYIIRAMNTKHAQCTGLYIQLLTKPYRWIPWNILPWELEGITSPCCLLIGQYPHHMTLCPPVAIVKRCFGIRLYIWVFLLQAARTIALCHSGHICDQVS